MRHPALHPRESIWNLLSEVEKAFDLANRDNHREYHPSVELIESENAFVLSMDLPGVPESAVKIEVDQGRLRINGARDRKGSFDRQFTLPTGADQEQIHARFENGVLEITVPKVVAAKPRQITINAPVKTESH